MGLRIRSETKRHSSRWKEHESPRPKTACQMRSKVKVTLILFFDIGLSTTNTSPKAKQWINITIEVLKRLRLTVFRKRQRNGNLARGFCNTTMHRRTQLNQFKFFFIANHDIPVVQQPLLPCPGYL